jgi:acyl-CoA synthetase (AMP-forming)/AMP-acid ligase II
MIWRSPHPDVAIPDVPLASLILSRAEERGDKPALVDGASGRVITYRQFVESVHHVAAALAGRGFGKGDVLAIYSPNLPEYAVVLYAVALLGGISTTVNPLYTPRELTAQISDAGATYLVTVPPLLDKAQEAVSQSGVREIIVFGEAEGATPVGSLLACDGDVPCVDIDPAEDVTVLPYSSGTTGLNKGVMLTHRNLVANLVQGAALGIGTEQDIFLGLLPFYHIYGMVCILHSSLYQGATLVTLPRFDLEQFLDTLERHHVTIAHLVPPIILALAKHPAVGGYDLSSLRLVLSGAAPLDESLAMACSARIGCTLSQGYGLTETSPVTHYNADASPPGSIGPCIPNTECMVVDPATGAELGPREQGELLVRGPQIMKGYLNNPAATARTIDRDGWLHTGDLGYADERGYFYIVDRLKELIKYKGMQVAPAELEGILLSHPMVADAAVIGSPDEEAGQVPKAFVVLKGQVAPEDLLGYVADRVAPYKKIRRIEVVIQIPKSASGKILRRVLVERELQAATAGE